MEDVIADEVPVMAHVVAITCTDRACKRLENLLVCSCSGKVLQYSKGRGRLVGWSDLRASLH